MGTQLDAVVQRYKEVLMRKDSRLHALYCAREAHNPDSTRTEAALHWLMSVHTQSVDVNEEPNVGGPDFICQTERGPFLLEATCLETAAVSAESGLSNEFRPGAGSFRPISRRIYEKAIAKTKQLSGYNLPTLLAIATFHVHGGMLFDWTAARRLLTGKDYITFTPNAEIDDTKVETALEDSVFYSLGYAEPVDHCRRDISGIVLVHITSAAVNAIGALNPSPINRFEPQMLPKLLFMSIAGEPTNEEPVLRIVRNRPEAKYYRFPDS